MALKALLAVALGLGLAVVLPLVAICHDMRGVSEKEPVWNRRVMEAGLVDPASPSVPTREMPGSRPFATGNHAPYRNTADGSGNS